MKANAQGELFRSTLFMERSTIQLSSTPEERGAVFTRPEVVDFILDLAGYTPDHPLHEFRILEPSFGEGDFLLRIVQRLLSAYGQEKTHAANSIEDLAPAIRAVEVHSESIEIVRRRVTERLRASGIAEADADAIADSWIIEDDFLLTDLPHMFTHAVGNPPYVRQELVPDHLLAEYRSRYSTIYDRADLYIPFMEKCLDGLAPGGTLGFICADRWMKNRYGGPLRAMIADRFHLAAYVDMVDTPAFHADVISYPAITIIKREAPGPTRIAHRPEIDRKALKKLALDLISKSIPANSGITEAAGVTRKSDPWLLQAPARIGLIRRLERQFPSLEDTGCKVGIGVATGADRVFIGPLEKLDVEADRKLPLVTTKDIETGEVHWKGLGVINPFREDGRLIDLSDYPKFASYLEDHAGVIRRRNVARKNPKSWYRTIDRINPALTHQSKLLIPDIKGKANVVYDEGNFYPHHNLYFITSDQWDLRALQAVLLSKIVQLIVSTYSTQMRGGYLRFQAQYLRRIRLPFWKDVPTGLRKRLRNAAISRDIDACNLAAFDLFNLTAREKKLLQKDVA